MAGPTNAAVQRVGGHPSLGAAGPRQEERTEASRSGLDVAILQRTAGNRAVARLIGRGDRQVHPLLQAKLMVGAVNDPLEREADRVADSVIRAWSSRPASRTTVAVGEPEVRRLAEPRHDPASGFEADATVARRLSARRGSGRPLPPAVRERMEAGFGSDFGAVRVHRDAEAAELSSGLCARAFTSGRDIYFGRGAYDMSSPSGRHLLTHELTHVAQQGQVLRAGVPSELPRQAFVQRTFLENFTPTKVWHTRTASWFAFLSTPFQKRAIAAVRQAVEDYEKATTPDELRASLDGLNTAIGTWETTQFYGGKWNQAVRELKADVVTVEKWWPQIAEAVEYEEAHPDWEHVPRQVGDLRTLYKDLTGPTSHPKVSTVSRPKAQQIGVIVGRLSTDYYEANFSTFAPDDGDRQSWFADYQRIEALMKDRSAVRALLEPLDDELAKNKNLTLTRLLEKYEAKCGFPTVHVIPLGVLPASEFLRLIAMGLLVKDYGAGVAHGELTHRLQWHAIMRAVTKGFTVAFDEEAGWRHSPFELYTAMGRPPLDEGDLTRASLWGRLVDQSDYGFTFSKPAQMNAELMNSPDFRRKEAQGAYAAIKKGDWATVQQFVAEPESLKQIWRALLKRAVKQNQEVPESRRGGLDEPTAAMIEQYAAAKLSGEKRNTYELLSSGTVKFDGTEKEWKVLIGEGEQDLFGKIEGEWGARRAASRSGALLAEDEAEGSSDLVRF
jgi:hypothetical protein